MLKLIIATALSLLLFTIGLTGCVTDKAYKASKTIYLDGKAIVVENYDKLSDKTKAKLESIDEKAQAYDKSRAIISSTREELKNGN